MTKNLNKFEFHCGLLYLLLLMDKAKQELNKQSYCCLMQAKWAHRKLNKCSDSKYLKYYVCSHSCHDSTSYFRCYEYNHDSEFIVEERT